MENWSVYIHIFPNNKYYIGITSQNVEYRWNRGNGYKSQKLVYAAINKYGWDNITSKILQTGLTKTKAIEYEKFYISKYKSNKPEYGYNLTEGGEGHSGYSPTAEAREKNRISNLGQKRNEAFRERLRQVNLGKKHTAETKHKISKALRQRGSPNISEEGRKRIKENAKKVGLANKGRIQTPESNLARSLALQGIIRSPETKRKMSKPKSAETIEKMKKAQRLRREKERLNKMKEDEVARVDPGRVGGQ